MKPGHLAEVSDNALRDAWDARDEQPAVIARRLYQFGSSEVDPKTARAYATLADAQQTLGVADGARNAHALESRWKARRTLCDGTWIGWRRAAAPSNLRYKLYVSPLAARLAPVFDIVATSVPTSAAGALKVVAGSLNLPRPDKLIVYFADAAGRDEFGRTLAGALAAVSESAQGVPFTCDTALDGLLSHALDPPPALQDRDGTSNSWRRWLVRRIACAIVAAQTATADFACARALIAAHLRRFDVDIGPWSFLRPEGDGENVRYALGRAVRIVPRADLDSIVARSCGVGPRDAIVVVDDGRVPAKVIDEDARRLLEAFSEPRSVAAAMTVLDGGPLANADDHTIAAARRFVDAMAADGILVETSRSQAESPGYATGMRIAESTLEAPLQITTGSAVFRARLDEGMPCVVKFYRAVRELDRFASAAREIALLRMLNGEPAPRLVRVGAHADAIYAVLEECAGASPASPATPKIGQSIIDAYVRLHAAGVIHGDVRPKNLFVERDGRVRILDFDLGWTASLAGRFPYPGRGGATHMFEPEFARALLDGRGSRVTLPTAEGDQYGVAALIYALLTGKPHIDFSTDRGAALRQIAKGEASAEGWEIVGQADVLRVLRRALHPLPAQRFASMAEFAEAFRAAWSHSAL